MIRELTKSYLRNNPTVVCICPGDSVHDIECMLIDTYHCYYWNGGDIHQDTMYHTSDIFDHNHYFLLSYEKSKDIIILDLATYWDPLEEERQKSNMISSKMLYREKKLKKLKKKCSKLER
jgi:hypothetical protein